VPGCPIRKSADLMLVCSSPQLIAAYHVLHRLSEPRHPPYALKCFKRVITITRHLQLKFLLPNMSKSWFNAERLTRKAERCVDVMVTNHQTLCHTILFERTSFVLLTCIWLFAFRIKRFAFSFFCGGYRSRTDDPLRARQML
jgi:hypothetical protein